MDLGEYRVVYEIFFFLCDMQNNEATIGPIPVLNNSPALFVFNNTGNCYMYTWRPSEICPGIRKCAGKCTTNIL